MDSVKNVILIYVLELPNYMSFSIRLNNWRLNDLFLLGDYLLL